MASLGAALDRLIESVTRRCATPSLTHCEPVQHKRLAQPGKNLRLSVFCGVFDKLGEDLAGQFVFVVVIGSEIEEGTSSL